MGLSLMRLQRRQREQMIVRCIFENAKNNFFKLIYLFNNLMPSILVE